MPHDRKCLDSRTPLSVNWTVTTNCNYNCRYCFARFPEISGRTSLTSQEMCKIPFLLSEAGCKKITFVGGEPLLSPILPSLLRSSHELGLTTMIVTNGSFLTSVFLEENHEHIDWISLSIDSQNENVQQKIGRGEGEHVAYTIKNAQLVKDYGIRLKVNTVVTKLNFQEDMSELIGALEPDRWKVFQVLPICGQNDDSIEELVITEDDFSLFQRTHRHVQCAVFEDNHTMLGSYLMLSPHGEFFSNVTGKHVYTKSILDVGIGAALAENAWNMRKFIERGGIYAWNNKHNENSDINFRRC